MKSGMTPHERGVQAMREQEARRRAAKGLKPKKAPTGGAGTPASGFSEHFSDSDMKEYQAQKK